MHLDAVLQQVLALYPGILSGEPPNFLGNHGGFSGARLWQVSRSTLCLKAWPANGIDAGYLSNVHERMRQGRAAGLDFVPNVLLTRDGRSAVEHAGRTWDVTTWMPGAADFLQCPSKVRLQAACVALARLHSVWACRTSLERCPAVLRRMKSIALWQELRTHGWRPAFAAGSIDPVQPWAERAWDLVLQHLDALPGLLQPFAERRVPSHPCLCDVWSAHILFRSEEVSGIVDYGSLKDDHAAVDLARLLGSLVGDDEDAWALGLRCYRELRPLAEWEERLARTLDRTGTVLAAANWLRWLYHEGRDYDDRQAVASRFETLVRRMDSWVRIGT
jgi:Ser/Thr protein kinase RdoA (MazF antagonist)